MNENEGAENAVSHEQNYNFLSSLSDHLKLIYNHGRE